MYQIAVVDDENVFQEQISEYIKKYQEENEMEIQTVYFADGLKLLESYQCNYDLILLDIEMPGMNGMEVAKKIREKDEEVILMFITNMAQYAIHGYSVGALDFVTKPINYYTFSMKMRRALKRVQKKENEQKSIVLMLSDGMKKIETKRIYFVEVQNRMLYYHTEEGEYSLKGTMQSVEKMLESDSFVKCNHWYLVNLRHVKEVKNNLVSVGDHKLEISRRNKKAFMQALTEYLGGNV